MVHEGVKEYLARYTRLDDPHGLYTPFIPGTPIGMFCSECGAGSSWTSGVDAEGPLDRYNRGKSTPLSKYDI
jgi:hypothetical protein